jgi:D-sedoheptulose 7-phosphate isomerase
MNIKVFGFLRCKSGEALKSCDEAFIVSSDDTGRIQEAHITAGHALMEYIESKLLEPAYLNLQEW